MGGFSFWIQEDYHVLDMNTTEHTIPGVQVLTLFSTSKLWYMESGIPLPANSLPAKISKCTKQAILLFLNYFYLKFLPHILNIFPTPSHRPWHSATWSAFTTHSNIRANLSSKRSIFEMYSIIIDKRLTNS